ncbi:hypothetical protein GCK32_012730 [Trichostrongylus colubriformis]|uniref:Tyrosine-protein phosphatase domain-containing protein n=1 Tax=Trichostrongylus colubriformis TaxID=6319 RepID=A0AAN8F6V6_TRICO
MLEAIDIVLICLGSVLSILASFAIFLLLIFKRRKSQQKTNGSAPKVAVAKEFYRDQPPTISTAVKNGTAPQFVSKPAAANLLQRCTRYWPLLGEVQQFREVEVDLISESEDPICLHREFDIRKNGERRQVSQYHLLNWRDAKGPESTTHLLDFIERVRQKQYRKPIVVHCRTVDSLRQQRSRMVQTPEQYLSLYEAISLAIAEERL